MTENTLEKLAQLLEQDQFELIFSESGAGRGQDIRLVYLMNDAVESFLVFRDARMTGEYHAEYEGELEASLNKQGEEFVLVVKQGETVLTLFFEKMDLEVHLYEYAYTGHFWVKGYEYLRQLEYRLAILRDKYDYLGEEYCTEEEKRLAQGRAEALYQDALQQKKTKSDIFGGGAGEAAKDAGALVRFLGRRV